MAVTKYPNYLEEILKLKLKEDYADDGFEKIPSIKEKFKFSNVSEECLNLAVKLARRDVEDGNISYASFGRKRPPDNEEDDDDNCSNVQDDLKVLSKKVFHNKETSARAASPPTRDLNSKAIKGKRTFISPQEVSLRVYGSIRNIEKLIMQIKTLASVDVRTKFKKIEDPIEAERRQVRLGERSHRINRLSYDLNRGIKNLMGDVRRGRKQEALKKLLHSYKELVKVLQTITMHMSDSPNPPKFLHSKIFTDLITFLRNIEISADELDVKLDSVVTGERPALKLKKIVESVIMGRENFPPMRPSLLAQPSLRMKQDVNNNRDQHSLEPSLICLAPPATPLSDVGPSKSNKPTSKDLVALKEQINRIKLEEQNSKAINDNEMAVRKQQLNQWMKVLVEKNLEGDGIRETLEPLVDSNKEGLKNKSNKNFSGCNKVAKVAGPGRGLSLLCRGQGQMKSTDQKNMVTKTGSTMFSCKHKAMKNQRSKSSPPRILGVNEVTQRNQRNNKCKSRQKTVKPGHTDHKVKTLDRSKSWPRQAICPNCETAFEIQRDSDHVETVSESSSSTDNSMLRDDITDELIGLSDKTSSGPANCDIKKLEKRLKHFEMERRKIKERWNSGFENVGKRDLLHGHNDSERPWIDNFVDDFKNDVRAAKNIFHLSSSKDQITNHGLSDDFSLNLLRDWERRDREFFSFNLFMGESGDGNFGSASSITNHQCSHSSKSQRKINEIFHDHAKGSTNEAKNSQDDDHQHVNLISKIVNTSRIQEPVNLTLNREAFSDLVMENGDLKKQIKDAILRTLNSEHENVKDHIFLTSRVAKDLLEDCLHEVCNEVDFVGNDIVNRIYKSELSASTDI